MPDSLSRCVLIVDDEVFIRLLLSDVFEEAGFVVREAVDADEATTLLREGTPVDLVVSDVRMPGDMNGFGLASWVRKHRPETQVIMMSGYFGEQDGERADGNVPFLRKPFQAHQVLTLAKSLLAST